jgi:hypothetical protein
MLVLNAIIAVKEATMHGSAPTKRKIRAPTTLTKRRYNSVVTPAQQKSLLMM